MKLIPLLLLVVIACWTQATIFEASGIMQCSLPGQTWCVHLYLYEIDLIKDDLLGEKGRLCTSGKQVKYLVEGEEDGDGIWDDHYELKLKARHNCSTHGELLDVWSYEKSAPVNSKYMIDFPWSYNLTDKGIRVPGKD
uniref:Uncharacterized protein n=1 Tax=Caenorhabditis japonica TaxID=281687 RepID=A0A8R1HS22_CAEJA